MPNIIENDGQIQIMERIPAGLRVFLFIVGLLPWLAPYEFLIKPGWMGLNAMTVFFVIISLGAIVVSLFFLAAAVFGLNQTFTFDSKTRTIVHAYGNVVAPLRLKKYTFGQLKSIEIVKHDWTDAPSTYGLKLTFIAGHKFEPGPFASLDAAHALKERVEQMIMQ